MSYQIRARQARCAALGFWPGPIDGIDGPRTRAAYAAACAAQAAWGRPFAHPTGITRIHWHWTAGNHQPNATDLRAYHCLIPGEGAARWPVDPTAGRSHTLHANGGAIGVSLCAMSGARERHFDPGRAPITPWQVCQLARVTARLCQDYDIPVSRWSTLSHAEIQPAAPEMGHHLAAGDGEPRRSDRCGRSPARPGVARIANLLILWRRK